MKHACPQIYIKNDGQVNLFSISPIAIMGTDDFNGVECYLLDFRLQIKTNMKLSPSLKIKKNLFFQPKISMWITIAATKQSIFSRQLFYCYEPKPVMKMHVAAEPWSAVCVKTKWSHSNSMEINVSWLL